MKDSLASLSPMIINSVFLGFSLSFTSGIQFWIHVRHPVSSAKLESNSYGPMLDIYGCHRHIDDG